MDKLIEYLETFGFGAVVILFIGFILIILGSVVLFKKVKELFDGYYDRKRKEEKNIQDIDERFNAIEEAQKKDHKQLMDLKNDLEDVRGLIVKLQEDISKSDNDQKKANRAQSRSAMMRLSNELLERGYMSEMESETLNDLVGVFMQSATSGDSYVVPSLVARALKLQVLTAEEIHLHEKKENRKRKSIWRNGNI